MQSQLNLPNYGFIGNYFWLGAGLWIIQTIGQNFNKNFNSKKYQTKNDPSLNQSQGSFTIISRVTAWKLLFELYCMIHGLRAPNEGINQRNLKMRQTKYALVLPKIWEWELIFCRAVKGISSPGMIEWKVKKISWKCIGIKMRMLLEKGIWPIGSHDTRRSQSWKKNLLLWRFFCGQFQCATYGASVFCVFYKTYLYIQGD